MQPVVDAVVYVIPQPGNWLADAAGMAAAIAAIFSAATALVAFFYTKQQSKSQKELNALMVKPFLGTKTIADNKDRLFTVTLINSGLGPAVLKKISIFADGKLEDDTPYNAIRNATEKSLPWTEGQRFYGMFTVGSFVPAGDSSYLVKCIDDKVQASDCQTQFNDKVRILIEYEDIFGNHYVMDTDTSKDERRKNYMPAPDGLA